MELGHLWYGTRHQPVQRSLWIFHIYQHEQHHQCCTMYHILYLMRASTASKGLQLPVGNRNPTSFLEILDALYEGVHYVDVIMTTVASQITSLTVVYSIVYSGADERKHQSSASLAFVWGIYRDRWIPRTKGQLRGKKHGNHFCQLYNLENTLMAISIHTI